ncbi:MAG: methyl-accepting chemotaxis sensory transducer [Herbinix sp.]|jgi:methyl-accepting chemotaxis protein|nr:methyl-accepting chemotaxis sensory transducer [Herbinix sp.]
MTKTFKIKELLQKIQFKRKKIGAQVIPDVQEVVDQIDNKKEGLLKKHSIKLPNKFLSRVSGIRIKLLIAFAIPIFLMAIFGVVSYNKSSKAIISNYEKISGDTLNAVEEYIFMGVDAVSTKSYELADNNKVKSYYKKAKDMTTEESEDAFNVVNEIVNTAKTSHSFIYSIHTIGEMGNSISTVDKLPQDIYNQFLASPEGQMIASSTERYMWIGKHSFLDDQLQNKQTTYAISIVRKMAENNGFVIIDVPTTQIEKAISHVDFGEGSLIGFVTEDGVETLSNKEETSVFSGLKYYQEAAAGNEPNGFSYEKYKGEDYLFLYSKIGSTGASLCALVPKDTILQQAEQLKFLSLIFVTLACILAGIIGTVIASGIGGEIVKLSKSIALAAKGDLTTKFDTKRNDEFLILSSSLTDMVGGMRNLIEKVATFGTKVNGSANTLSDTSSDILGSTKDISLAIDEIEKGVVQQANDTEQCLFQMSDLSDKINQVYQNTYEIEQIAKDTKLIVGNGLVTMDELNNKSSATTDITHVVINEIEGLEVQTRSIANFVGVINDIASQTNLLSLNASIEAARAGDAGRGFAVVAEEIRKLADQSMNASNQITGIVSAIQNKTKGTVVSAKQAKDIVESQMEALTKTISTFENINEHVGSLVNNLNNIAEGVKGIESAKDETLDAIRNISAISQQTATSSEEVSATANNQITSVEYLSQSAAELAEDSKKLEEAIQIFQI